MCSDQQQLERSSQNNPYLQIYHRRATSHINSVQSRLSLKLCLMAACLPDLNLPFGAPAWALWETRQRIENKPTGGRQRVRDRCDWIVDLCTSQEKRLDRYRDVKERVRGCKETSHIGKLLHHSLKSIRAKEIRQSWNELKGVWKGRVKGSRWVGRWDEVMGMSITGMCN